MKRMHTLLGAVFLALSVWGATTVQGAELSRGVLTVDQDSVRKGQEVEVTFALESSQEAEDGINVLKGTLSYNKEVFRAVQAADFVTAADWDEVYYNPENDQLVVISKAGDKDGGEVFRLKLKANARLDPEETAIRFSDVAISEGREDLTAQAATVPVQVISDQIPGGGQTPAPQPPAQNETTAPVREESSDPEVAVPGTAVPETTAVPQQTVGGTQNQPGSAQSQSGSGQSVHPTPLPTPGATAAPQGQSSATPAPTATRENAQTPADGEDLVPRPDKTGFVLAGAVLVLFLLLVLLATRQGWLGKKVGRTLAALLAVGLLATVFGGLVYGLQGKGDLNDDGAVDYADVDLLGRQLVGLERLEDRQRLAADMNDDGRLTVTDLALLIRAVEKTVHYEVELFSATETRYFEKNQQVQLAFQARVTYDAKITEVTVNGETRPVTRAEDGSCYYLPLDTGAAAGALPCHITAVTLSGGQQVAVDFTETLEVLKDIPAIRDFTVEDLVDTAQMQAHFTLEDPDGAHVSAVLELTRTTGEGLTVLQSAEVETGENTVVLNVPEDEDCQLSIYVAYDRTGGTLPDGNDAYTGSTGLQKDIHFQLDYGFGFSALKTLDGETEQDRFGKNQPLTLQFRSSNRTKFVPETVTVNGADYPVTALGAEDLYGVTLPGFGQSGTRQIRVERVILSNGKVFVPEDGTVTVEIQKALPAVAELTVREEEAGRSLWVSFTLEDPDGAATNRKVVVKDADGAPLREVPFTGASFAETLELSGALTEAYTVEVTADCDISFDGSAAERDRLLGGHTIEALPRVEVTDPRTDKVYYEKGEWATLSWSVAANRAHPVEKLVVNNLELPVQWQEDGRCQVSLPVQDQPGAQTMRLSQAVLADGTIVKVQNEQQIQVLRARPTAENYQTWDDFDRHQVRIALELRDPDGAVTGGKAVLTADDGSEAPAEQAITAAGTQNFVFSVTEGKAYTFTVTLTGVRSEDGTQLLEEELLTRPVQMIRDYQLTVSALTPVQEDGTSAPYFEKGAPVRFSFTSENKTAFVPLTLVSGDREYPLTDDGAGQYTALLPAGSQAGVVRFAADALRMNNGKLVAIDGGREAAYEILRDTPAVDGFTYEKTDQDELRVQFTLHDPDGALQSARVKITDELGAVLLEEAAAEGPNTKTVELGTGERYRVTVTATYDRDSDALDDASNGYTDGEIFSQEVAASRDAIELKDVVSQTLYHRTDAGVQKVEMLDITQGLPDDLENYYAVIGMKDLPDFYAGIREFRLDDETRKLYVVLDREDLIAYGQDGTRSSRYAFPLAYRDADKDHVLIESAEELFRQMASDLSGTFELTCDLDASGLSTGSYAIPGTFSGILNGNGHTIYNLPVGLFQKLSRATVTDLVLEDASITVEHKGILAEAIDNQSVIERVFLVDCTLRNNSNMVGGFTGSLTNATIRQSAAINLTLKADNTIGGLVGQTYAGSKVEDCYVTGQLQGTRNHNLGARVGGITGWHSGTIIQRCITKVNITAPNRTGNGGIIGGPGSANSSKISHCVSLGGGTAYRIAGFTAALASAEAVYEYAGSDSATNRTDANAQSVLEVETPDRAFYADTLGLDAGTWYLDLAGGSRLPSLQGDPLPKNPTDFEIQENANSIPSYRRVRAQAAYRADREIAYGNLAALLPFADTADWVAYGNALPAGSSLLTRRIQYILPLDEAGQLVPGLDIQNPGAVQRIRMVFNDGGSEEQAVTYAKTLGDLVAVYRLEGADLPYQFRGYLKDLSQLDLAGLVQTASALDYHNDIASLTPETEGRLYLDYYTQSVQPKLETVLRSLILSQEQFPAYTANPAVQSLVRQQLQDPQTLARYLLAYNYYDKWYNISFGGVHLSDLLFFAGDLLDARLSARQLTDQLLAVASDLRGTGRTYDFYTQTLQPVTGMELLDFLARMAKSVGYDDPSDWFAAEFDGILVEQAPDTQREETIEYRIWHAFQTLGGRRQIVLPILTAPQEDMYILSVPSQMILGSMNRYGTYLNKDGGERERMRRYIENYAQRYGHFYGISANWITNAPSILNSFINIQYDTRFNFPANTVTNQGEQVKGVTQDPVIKWVYEAVGAYSDMGGVGAYANGTDVYCVAYPAIGEDFTFYALTHESAHNQDGRYFYAGYGRRRGTGPEAHADGNIAQQIEDGSMVFNISRICDPASDVTNNLSYERIRTADQVWDYYANMFETSYVIDYLAGQAFLQLEPEEQARVAIQVSYQPDGNSARSIYTRLTADQLREMDLQEMQDLWDNQIAIKTPGSRASGFGAYGYESFYDINWYQPHLDTGVTDSSSFKRLGQEMLGVGGYEGGYVTYISGKSPNDLQALRTATGKSEITWRDYKLGRYATVAANLDKIPYFEPEQVIEQFKQAFRSDNDKRSSSIALQRTLYGIIKRATGDFVTGGVYGEEAPIRITTAEELVQAVAANPMGYYLLEEDLDFSDIPVDQGAYIAARFIGTLDGDGHRLTGVSHTLFKEMVYGQIINLTVDSPAYSADAAAYLALSAKNTVISNVKVENTDLNLPLVKQRSGGYYEWGDVGVTIGQKTVSSEEEFLAIGASATGRKMDYILTRDLDFSGIALSGAVVDGTFSGKLDGDGHTIRGLSAPLFSTVDGAEVKNLTLADAAVTGNASKGLLANTLTGSRVENLRITGSSLTNDTNQVGLLAGLTRASTLRRITVENSTVTANNTVGGVAGQMDGTTLENCLVTGTVRGVINNSLGSRAGGITGWLSGDSTLKNCYVKVQIAGAKPTGDGGLIGGPNTGNAKLYHSVSLSTGPNAYRISGFPVLGIAENVYELESSDSLTNRDETNADRIKTVTEEETLDPAFYTGALGWSEEIWDFSRVADGGTPRLRTATLPQEETISHSLSEEDGAAEDPGAWTPEALLWYDEATAETAQAD